MDTADSLYEDNLFADEAARSAIRSPLAVRMRPRTIDEIVGQDKILGKGTWLRSLIENDNLVPLILFGPPGTGKTTLARVIAKQTSSEFEEVSAIGGSVSDLRKVIEGAQKNLSWGRKTILFVDEIHRFNKAQQDALLHAVEDRVIILVGATTENPYFEVNSALLSRMRVVNFESVAASEIEKILLRALTDERGFDGKLYTTYSAIHKIAEDAAGDVRAALTSLDLAADIAIAKEELEGEDIEDIKADKFLSKLTPQLENATSLKFPVITLPVAIQASPRTSIRYDKNGDEHYDIVSAFIKSMRGSDPDAAVYWLARMIDGGEDPKFIARRIFILAAEDVGLADPNALTVAASAFKSAEVIGYPECRIPLAEAAIYMARAPKSNSAYMAINAALEEVQNGPARKVPDYLRDRHRPGAENYGKYKYPHEYQGHYVEQQYLPDGLEKGVFYQQGELDKKQNH